jgi:hypothetical protein
MTPVTWAGSTASTRHAMVIEQGIGREIGREICQLIVPENMLEIVPGNVLEMVREIVLSVAPGQHRGQGAIPVSRGFLPCPVPLVR